MMGYPVGVAGMPVLACQAVNIGWISTVGEQAENHRLEDSPLREQCISRL